VTEDASAGRLHVDVVADVSGFRRDAERKLRAELAALRAEVKARVDFAADQVRRDLAAALRAGAAGAAASARVDFDSGQVRRALAEALRGAGSETVTVRVQVDDRDARRDLDRLGRDTTVRVRAEADTRPADDDIERFRRSNARKPVRVPVEVDRSSLAQAADALASLARFPAIASGIALAAGAATNLAGGLYAVAAAGSQAVGTLAALPNLLGVAAQGIASLFLGFSGIGEAVKALGKAQQAAGTQAARSAAQQVGAAEQVRAAQERLARAQEDAVERIRAARENLARVQESAAERVAAAERRFSEVQADAARRVAEAQQRVVDAHEARRRALEDLDRAIERAIERQEDLALAVAGAALDEEAAELAVERARLRLEQISKEGSKATDLERREADLAYRQALHRLAEVRERNEDLAKEKAEADRKGIKGADEVVAAQKRVEDATKAIADAERNLKAVRAEAAQDVRDAQIELAKARRDAARSVADARRQVQMAQRDAARAIADAQRAVQQAMSRTAAGAGSTSAAVRGVASALDELSPAGQRFARFVHGTLIPRFQELRSAVQEALLPHIQRAVVAGLPLLDTLQRGLVGTAHEVGSFAERLGQVVSSRAFRSDVTAIMASNNRAMRSFGEATLALIPIMARIARVAGPLLVEPFARWVRELAEAAAASDRLSESRIADFLGRAANSARTLGAILRDVGAALYNIGRAARPSGDTLLDDLAGAAERLRAWTEDRGNVARMQAFFENAIPVMRETGNLLNRVVGLFLRLGEITGGSALEGVFAVLNAVVSILEGIASVPGGGQLLSIIFALSGAGMAIGLTAKAVMSVARNIATLARFTRLGAALSWLWNTKAVQAMAAAVGRATVAIGRFAAAQARAAGAGLASAARSAAAAIGTLTAAAGRGVKAMAAWAAAQARAAGAGLASAARSAAAAIGTMVVSAGRGAVALGALALAYGQTAASAALAQARQLAAAAAAGVVRAATAAWTAAQWLLNAALNANPIALIVIAITALVAGLVWAYNNVSWFRRGVDAAFQAVGKVTNWLWKTIIQPVFQAIGQAATWLWSNAITPAFNGVKKAIDVVGAAFRWFNDKIVQPVMGLVGGAIKVAVGLITGNFDLVKRGLSQMGTAWNTIWTNVRTFLSTTYNNYIRPLLDKLGTLITDTVPDAFKTGVEAIRKFWDKVRDIAKKPVSFIVNTVYNDGIRRVWNWVAEKVNLPELPEVRGFATGGIYPGYTPGRDVGLAAVSGGEAIMRPEWTRAVGPAFVHWMNRVARTGGVRAVRRLMAMLTGGLVGGYARGGIIPGVDVPFAGGFSIGGIVSRFFKAAKRFFADGLRKALIAFTDPVIELTERTIGGTGWGRLVAGIPRALRDSLIGFLMRFADRLEGGGDPLGVVAAARKYIGIGDDRGPNNNIFTRAWGWPGAPWCAMFVSRAIQDAKAQKHYPGWPSAAVYGYYSKMKKVGVTSARPGDLGVWGGPYTHINIIEKYLGGSTVQTIGGNENALVRRDVRSGPYAVLRPNYALGGIVDRRVFAERNLGWRHDVSDPLIRLLMRLRGTLAEKVAEAVAQTKVLGRDRGGPLPPGLSWVYNGTRRAEWVLTPEAVDLLGGPQAVARLNQVARLHQAGSTVATFPARRVPVADRPVTVNVYPQPRQSEEEIGAVAARRIGWMLRAS